MSTTSLTLRCQAPPPPRKVLETCVHILTQFRFCVHIVGGQKLCSGDANAAVQFHSSSVQLIGELSRISSTINN